MSHMILPTSTFLPREIAEYIQVIRLTKVKGLLVTYPLNHPLFCKFPIKYAHTTVPKTLLTCPLCIFMGK